MRKTIGGGGDEAELAAAALLEDRCSRSEELLVQVGGHARSEEQLAQVGGLDW